MRDNQKLYLKQNVQIEPLFNQWYAVSLTIPPATGAMFVSNSHLKIMKSYILSPEMHAAASQDPVMMGGPFINYKEQKVAEIKALLDQTLRESTDRINFAEAVKSLDQMLSKEAVGFSLEPLYQHVPDILKGYVELVYDLNNHPSIRFIEKLLYKSRFYNTSSQSLGLSLVTQDERPFVLSTPRLNNDDYLHLKISFADEGLDELIKMKDTPKSFGEIKDTLGFADEYDELFRSFLTEAAPLKNLVGRYQDDGLRIRYFGHACLLIETKGVSILTDPFISYKYDSPIPRFTYADLPDVIDYVLITHGHLDHILLESLLQTRRKIRNIIVPRNSGGFLADPSLRLLLEHVGFRNVLDISELETLQVEGGSITTLPFLGEHHDLNIRSKTAYLIKLAGQSICVAADSCNLESKLCEHIRENFGKVDVLFIGMECDGAPLSWFYGALLTKPLERGMDQSRKGSASNHQRGIEMAARLDCKQVYVYAMGLEPWLSYVLSINFDEDSLRMVESNNFISDCRSRGITAEMLFGQKELLM
jgi:L-ascorbate metabolism protein UlaG (beta-lactamase superfamily)